MVGKDLLNNFLKALIKKEKIDTFYYIKNLYSSRNTVALASGSVGWSIIP